MVTQTRPLPLSDISAHKEGCALPELTDFISGELASRKCDRFGSNKARSYIDLDQKDGASLIADDRDASLQGYEDSFSVLGTEGIRFARS